MKIISQIERHKNNSNSLLNKTRQKVFSRFVLDEASFELEKYFPKRIVSALEKLRNYFWSEIDFYLIGGNLLCNILTINEEDGEEEAHIVSENNITEMLNKVGSLVPGAAEGQNAQRALREVFRQQEQFKKFCFEKEIIVGYFRFNKKTDEYKKITYQVNLERADYDIHDLPSFGFQQCLNACVEFYNESKKYEKTGWAINIVEEKPKRKYVKKASDYFPFSPEYTIDDKISILNPRDLGLIYDLLTNKVIGDENVAREELKSIINNIHNPPPPPSPPEPLPEMKNEKYYSWLFDGIKVFDEQTTIGEMLVELVASSESSAKRMIAKQTVKIDRKFAKSFDQKLLPGEYILRAGERYKFKIKIA